MLFSFLAAAALAAQSPAEDPCAGQQNCVQASAAQLFALADQLFAKGDFAGAEDILIALQQDPDPKLRAEARFRLAALREQRGDVDGAIAALRDLLAEQPNAQRARLDLSRLLAAQGKSAEARRELQQAQESGLPPDVARTVSRFSNLLSATKRRGGSIELTAGPDSNVNRSTSAQFIDTVIAPFELDPDARKQSGLGITASLEGYSRDDIGKTTFLTRGGARGDFFPGKGRFSDVQAYLGSGPEFDTKIGRIRPAATVERRWFGGDPYSFGAGGALSLIGKATARSQIEVDLSVVRQWVADNDVLDGTRYAAVLTYDRALTEDTTARFNLRGAILDAAAKSESLHQGAAEAILAHDLGFANIFGNLAYTKTHGQGVLALFGETRDDDRIDVGAGLVARRAFHGFAPVVRVTYARSWSNIALYDYSRARLDLGVTRGF
jgi:tetratricopeptide (TPR) repeat protein